MKTIRLKIWSDGTAAGTRLLDADTGEEVAFEGAFSSCSLSGEPGATGKAVLLLSWPGLPVEVAASVTGPFRMEGGHPGGMAGVALPHRAAAPAPTAAAAASPAAQARQHNDAMNKQLIPGRV